MATKPKETAAPAEKTKKATAPAATPKPAKSTVAAPAKDKQAPANKTTDPAKTEPKKAVAVPAVQVGDPAFYIDHDGKKYPATVLLLHTGDRADLVIQYPGQNKTEGTVPPCTGKDDTHVWYPAKK